MSQWKVNNMIFYVINPNIMKKKVFRMAIRKPIKNCRKGKGCQSTSHELMQTNIKIAA